MLLINFYKKVLIGFLFFSSLFIISISCSQINYETRYKEQSWQEIVENPTNDERKIDSFIFYSIVHYKKDIFAGGNGNDILDNIRNRQSYKLNDKNQIYLEIRLNVKSYYEAGPIKLEIEALGGEVRKIHVGHNNFIELSTWIDLDKILDVAQIENVAVFDSFLPIMFR